jgi:hypothetical protein
MGEKIFIEERRREIERENEYYDYLFKKTVT